MRWLEGPGTYMTGALIISTAFHSFQFNGIMWKRDCKIGVYNKAKCKAIERVMAYTSIMLSHNGRVRRDSEEDKAFMAFNISMTTRMESETVDADLDMSFENMEHPMSENWVEQRWK